MINPILIPEILLIISNELDQFDLINLIQLNKFCYNLLKFQIYKSITIDCYFNQFDKEFYDYGNGNKTTYIKSKSNIISFFKSVLNNNNCKLIRSFIVVKLPLEFIDFEKYIGKYLIDYNNLNKLIIESFISLNILNELSLQNLNQLSVKINNFNNNGVKLLKLKNKLNLTDLSIKSFKNNDELQMILNGLLSSSSKLNNLRLVKRKKNTISNEDSDIIQLGSICHNLKKLSLHNMIIKPNDYLKLKFVENSLLFLELNQLTELSNTNETFLDYFKPKKLKFLKINLTNNNNVVDNNYSILRFLKSLPKNSLSELDLITNLNNITSSSEQSQINDGYIDMILDQATALTKLSFEIPDSNQVISNDQFNKLFILNKFKNLNSLRISLIDFNHQLIPNKSVFFKNLSSLKHFWILNPNSIAKHFGLGNLYPGILDNWLKIQHLPLKLIETNLAYFKIDECLFELKNNEVIPRDSIDDWFDRTTRVLYEN